MASEEIYYSDDEQAPNEVTTSKLSQQKQKDAQSLNELEKKIKEYYEYLQSIIHTIPIKDTITFQTQNTAPNISVCSSASSRKTSFEIHVEKAGVNDKNHPKTRSRGDPLTMAIAYELEEAPRPARSIAQTTFRHRKFARRKRAKGPQPDCFRTFLQRYAKMELEEEKKQNKQKIFYSSEDQTEPGQQPY